MSQGFRIVIETFDLKTKALDVRSELKTFKLTAPKHIEEVGLNHMAQIDILQQILDNLLVNQCALVDEEEICPSCGKKTKKAGKISSHFHSVYTDHKVKMVRRICQCGWANKPTIEGKYGISSHPDLLKMQCELGSEQSYIKAEEILTKKNARKRPINNHMRISRNVDSVGKVISNLKCHEPIQQTTSKTIVVQVDGGHIASKEKRSYEVLIGKVYNPESLTIIDKNHSKIGKSTCVASALADKNSTIKKQIVCAAKQEGMIKDTIVYVISDGAKNCWSAVNELKKHTEKLISILDWSHIGRKFKNVEQQLPENFHRDLEGAKWYLWHGEFRKSLERLSQIKDNLPIETNNERLVALCSYIKSNAAHIINYEEYESKDLPFTSSVIESAVDTLINDRQARTKKMQWTREGAHHVMQIRASIASKTWDQDWKKTLNILLAA